MKAKHIIDITLYMDPEITDVAAARVTHPKSISRKRKYSEQQLADFNDLVESVISILVHYNFDIIHESQSSQSYAYYIEFLPTDENGDVWDEVVGIKFRLADHRNKGAESEKARKVYDNYKQSAEKKRITVIKSFFIGSTQYPGPMSVITAIRDICKNLKDGNYDVLDKYI